MKKTELNNLKIKYFCQALEGPDEKNEGYAKARLGQVFNFDALNQKLSEREISFAMRLGKQGVHVPSELLDPTTSQNFSVGLALDESIFAPRIDCKECQHRENCSCSKKEQEQCLEDEIISSNGLVKYFANNLTFKKEPNIDGYCKVRLEDGCFVHATFFAEPIKKALRKSKYIDVYDYIYKIRSITLEDTDNVFFKDISCIEDYIFYFDGEAYRPLYHLSKYCYEKEFGEINRQLKEIPNSQHRMIVYGMMLANKKYAKYYYYHMVFGWNQRGDV